jgi:hypothetical protein
MPTVIPGQENALVINLSSSRCGACGLAANLHEKTHVSVPGYGPEELRGEGCGVEWTHVTSDYVGDGVKHASMSLRPDLEWLVRPYETRQA